MTEKQFGELLSIFIDEERRKLILELIELVEQSESFDLMDIRQRQ